MFKDIDKTLEQARKRWKTIEDLADQVRNPSKHDLEISSTEYTCALAKLAVALVEHLRPMNPTEEQLGAATSKIEDLLKSLKK